MKIIKTSEALPKSGRYVLAWLEGAKTPMRAMWADQHTLPLGDDADPEWGEYSEEKDEYFCPAGWYEMNQFEEQHWGVSGNVVAWCELPRLDHQCLAQIEEPAGAAPAAVAPEHPPMPETWAVVASIEGQDVVCISSNALSGKGELTESEEQAVIGMAQHLLAFVGYGLPPCDFDPDDEAVAAPALEAPAAPAEWQIVENKGTGGHAAGFYVFREAYGGNQWMQDKKRRIACFATHAQAVAAIAAAAPQAPAASQTHAGLLAAAAHIQAKAQAHLDERGNYDPDTGAVEMSDANQEHFNTLDELADEIRMMADKAAPASCDRPPAGWTCSRASGHDGPCAAAPAAPAVDAPKDLDPSLSREVYRACEDLPEGWAIRIDLENGYGGVKLIDPDGEENELPVDGLLSDAMRESIAAAIAAQAKEGCAESATTVFPLHGDESEESDLSEWQPGTSKPAIEGRYLREFDEGEAISWFTDGKWTRDGFFDSDIQDAPWRGLAAQAAAKGAGDAS